VNKPRWLARFKTGLEPILERGKRSDFLGQEKDALERGLAAFKQEMPHNGRRERKNKQ